MVLRRAILLAVCLGTFGLPLLTSCAERRPDDIIQGCRDWTRVITVDHREGIHFDFAAGRHFREAEFVFEDWDGFAEGLRVAKRRQDGKKGYIDRSGRVVIPFQYDGAGEFGDGRACVQVGEATGIIDKSGRWIVEPGRYEDIYGFGDGRCAFLKEGRWGFLDRDGKVVIPPVYQEGVSGEIPSFSDGLCLVKDQAGKRVYIDRDGRVRIRFPEGDWQGCPFYEGMARVSVFFSAQERGPLDADTLPAGYRTGFMSRDGRIVIEPRFGTAGNFSEGLAPVTITEDGLFSSEGGELAREWNPDPAYPEPPPAWGFINKKGEVVIPMVYQKALHFREGLAPVRQGGKWGYIDHQGRMVIGAGFEEAKEFGNGMAEVVIGGKKVYIDRLGHIILRTDRDSIHF